MSTVQPRRILLYLTEKGSSPFERWFLKLKDLQGKAAVAARIQKMKMGLDSNEKALGDGVYESKIYHGAGYRIYFGKEGVQIVVLLIGGTKRKQDKDIKEAKNCWLDYKRRKDAKTM